MIQFLKVAKLSVELKIIFTDCLPTSENSDSDSILGFHKPIIQTCPLLHSLQNEKVIISCTHPHIEKGQQPTAVRPVPGCHDRLFKRSPFHCLFRQNAPGPRKGARNKDQNESEAGCEITGYRMDPYKEDPLIQGICICNS
jgi:hypothetical protein